MNSFGGVIIKLTGYLKNITTKDIIIIDTTYKKINNKIKYQQDNDTYEIIINKDELYLIRDNKEINSTMHFKQNKYTTCDYKIKENDINLQIDLYTKKLLIKENEILINYQVENTDNYEYKIEIEV